MNYRPRLHLLRSTGARFVPYLLVGVGVFSLNSAIEMPTYFKIYLVLIEAQMGLLGIYFLTKRLSRLPKRENHFLNKG